MIDVKKLNIAEKDVLDFWESHKIYEKVVKKNAGEKKKFYMMDGPPYATGHIHMGTALNKILKDIAMRMKRMQKCRVFDRPGYDTHGVPIEFQVEKEIGSRSKFDIENYGVKRFVEKCKEFATKYIGAMNTEFKNLGVWMNWSDPYITLDDRYIEAIWTAFKEAEKKKLLYLGQYPVHVCTRCGTAVAYNEIEYGKQRDKSVFVKFPLKKKKNTYLIIWTTTPWTLPGNTGVMANPNVDYQEIEVDGERWIMAKELVEKITEMVEKEYEVIREFKGKDMEGWAYESPLAKDLKLDLKNSYRIVMSARYVSTEEGTGLVHCAPGHGKEDYEVGKQYRLDMPSPVSISGELSEKTGKYAGKKARVVDSEIVEDLKKDGYLVHELTYEHDYPLCWRDKSPLLMISQPQWFLKISEVHGKIISENEDTNWIPWWTKSRMKAWLEGIGDWPVSRQRYWGTPLPIWHDEESGEKIIIGSIAELKKLSGVKDIDIHKPGIDEIEIKSPHSGKILKRVPEVLDVWFDSGVSSWAALGYPQNDKKLKDFWPADLNIEGPDQFRGWWNSQLILSEITFGKRPFESVMVHGMVTDLSKKKMSKSLGNAVTPPEVIEKFGRDYLRYYFAKLSKGDNFAYDEKEFNDVHKLAMIILNINNFVNQMEQKESKSALEDRWIVSKYNNTVKSVTEAYNKYRFPEVVQRIENFALNDLSRTYIQIIRERGDEVYEILHHIRIGLLKLIAPIMPFMTERVWQELRKKKMVKEESIHLTNLPEVDKKKIDEKMEKNFENAFKIIEAGLTARDEAKVGLRWPLAKAVVYGDFEISKELEKIIMRQLNVKGLEFKKNVEFRVKLDTKMTAELEAEGFAREFARKVQAERKNAGLKKGDLIELKIKTDSEMKKILGQNIHFLQERTNSKKIEFVEGNLGEGAKTFELRDKSITIMFS